MLLAADVMASLDAHTGDLAVVGGEASERLTISTVERATQDSQLVTGGATSVSLDTDLLEAAAGLVLTGAVATAPAATGFGVGFNIEPTTDFRFATDGGFAPVGGTITHTGSVTFNNSVTLGNSSIGFDGGRASGDASGFFVKDTLTSPAGLVVFDISLNESTVVDFTDPDLTLGSTDLLVAPELAGFLGDAGLTGADVGDAQVDAVASLLQQRRVTDGETSVTLDTELLEAAAGLVITDAEATADPADGFGIAFDIGEDSGFQFTNQSGFTPLGGTINHTGSVTFNDSVTLGNFEIGLDPSRAIGDASGFFLKDTLTSDAGLVVFDIALRVDTIVDFTDPSLTIGAVDLLVSPELAGFLGNDGLTGDDVGDAQIDAETIQGSEDYIVIRGGYATTVNGGRSQSFPASDVDSISVDVGGGSDRVSARRVQISGDLSIDLGSGHYNYASLRQVKAGGNVTINGGDGLDVVSVRRTQAAALNVNTDRRSDSVRVTDSAFEDLNVDTGSGWDYAEIAGSHISRNANVTMGSGWDLLKVKDSKISGKASLSGGSGWVDSFYSSNSDYGDLDLGRFLFKRVY